LALVITWNDVKYYKYTYRYISGCRWEERDAGGKREFSTSATIYMLKNSLSGAFYIL